MTGCKRLNLTCVIFAVGLALSGQTALAATYSWGGADSVNWSDVLNWNPNTASPAIGDIAQFASGGAYANLPTVDTTWSVDGLWQTGATPVTISDAGFLLTLMGTNTINGNSNTGIEMDSAAGALTINPALTLNAAQTWINNSGSLLTIAAVNNNGKFLTISGSGNTSIGGIISGAGGLTATGSGTLTLNAANTYSGSCTVSGGTVVVGASAFLTGVANSFVAVNNGGVVQFSAANPFGYHATGGLGGAARAATARGQPVWFSTMELSITPAQRTARRG